MEMEDGEEQPPQHEGSGMPEAHSLAALGQLGLAGFRSQSLAILLALSCQSCLSGPPRVSCAEMQGDRVG